MMTKFRSRSVFGSSTVANSSIDNTFKLFEN
jgi:hypothetical protein